MNIDSIISSTNTNLGINLFLYCNNNPVLHSDSSGLFTFWDALDVISFVDSAYQMKKEPGLENFCWLLFDSFSLFPILPSSGVLRKSADAIANTAALSKPAKTIKVVSDSVDNTKDLVTSYQKGKFFEEIVQKDLQLPKYNGKDFFDGRNYKKPDLFDNKNNILYEVKNVKYQAYTKQLKMYEEFAKNRGGKLVLCVRGGPNGTKLSDALLKSGIEIVYYVF